MRTPNSQRGAKGTDVGKALFAVPVLILKGETAAIEVERLRVKLTVKAKPHGEIEAVRPSPKNCLAVVRGERVTL